jgi:NAD(P)-dependent dehydrogenase (short-subunit alcohol dehydrogenase family)
MSSTFPGLADQVMVVTGGASGIGAEVVRLGLEAGAKVISVDRTPPGAPDALLAGHPEHLIGLVGDVGQESTAVAFTRTALERFGRLDILVNNAGIACVKRLHEHSEAEWDRVITTNVKSLFWAARSVIPVMQRQHAGSIVNLGSISSVCGMRLQGAYGPSKGAVIQLTRQMAIDYAPDGIRVNAVCPGTVDTPLLRTAAEQSGDVEGFLRGLAAGHPIGRIATPDEIARLILFVASPAAGFMTGSILMHDGGYSAQ